MTNDRTKGRSGGVSIEGASAGDRRWFVERPPDASCDGVHPATHQPCTLGRHHGCHQTVGRLHWLDD
ncbi:hypothetical protein [Kribbella jejuensis]|uniref:hypothetical protein n=1 Tax=Kribbella jejuensis TaxID=236068 RepID=UPI001151A8EE|nr:hypothetical protein [Kribbella jejuensis]